MAYEVPVALISGGVGLATGVIGSLFGPWSNWGVEKRRRRQDGRAALIAQWRAGIRELRNAEDNHLARNQENRRNQLSQEPDPPEADPTRHEWFRRLGLELSDDAAERVDELRLLPIRDRKGQIPGVLEGAVLEIERKWKLPPGPV
jgi:hypothetical protein